MTPKTFISVGRFLMFLSLFPTLGWAQPCWEALKEKVIAADLAGNRKEEKKLAKEALALAESCMSANPQEVGCYYYRAQALGLSNQSFFGYVRRLRKMFADWEKVLAVDPAFDYGGPYRMIAEVYMELPKSFGPKDLRKDLNKAISLLKKAVAISNYPTNWLDLTEAYSMLGENEWAKAALAQAKKSLPQWKEYPYYPSWQSTLHRLDNHYQ